MPDPQPPPDDLDVPPIPPSEEEDLVPDEDGYRIPETEAQTVSSIKDKLRNYLEPLSRELLERLDKLEKSCNSDNRNLYEVFYELPLLVRDIRNHIENKRVIRQAMEREVAETIGASKARADKAEAERAAEKRRADELWKACADMRAEISLLHESKSALQKELLEEYKKLPEQWRNIAIEKVKLVRNIPTGLAQQDQPNAEPTQESSEQEAQQSEEVVPAEPWPELKPEVLPPTNAERSLQYIQAHPGCKAVDVSKELAIDKGQMSKIVGRLLEAKQIKRRKNKLYAQ